MPSYGSIRIPRSRLGILLDHMSVIHNKYPNSEFDKAQFIDALGLSHNSSGPDHKISDMIFFGLLVKGATDKKLSFSDLGNKILLTTGLERSSAIEASIKKIPLWEKLLNSVGEDTESEEFVSIVKMETGLGNSELSENINNIKFAYQEDISCIKRSPPFSIWTRNTSRSKKSQETTHNKINNTISRGSQTQITTDHQKINQIRGYRISSDYAGFQIEVKDANTYSVALQMLNSIKKELEKQGVKFEDNMTNG